MEKFILLMKNMKLKSKIKFPFKIHAKISWKAVYYFAFFISFLAIASSILFAYTYITSTITYTFETIQLKSIVSPESFSKEDFKNVLQKVEKKESFMKNYDATQIKNVFSEIQITATATTTIGIVEGQKNIPEPAPEDIGSVN